ncbi:MAG TPA: glycoside hydrolase family 15 protein [Nevskiaceae bacterium]|nr:glycoside hydrolase family 15 protein [Nevskiaceae bacterium]
MSKPDLPAPFVDLTATAVAPAPGAPGMAPTWPSSAKDVVSTALSTSRVWFTLSHGVLNEVFWPSCSLPQTRDLGFIVAGEDFWAEVKREHHYTLTQPAPEIPLPHIVHEHARYTLELEFATDPLRDVVLINYQLHGQGLKLYVLLAPHLGGDGQGNTAWVAAQALMAAHGTAALALVDSEGFTRGSAGYVGGSDGWQDFNRHGAMQWAWRTAGAGNVALTGELAATSGTLALGFAKTPEGAQTVARSALASGYQVARRRFIASWQAWARNLNIPAPNVELGAEARRSAMVLKVHNDRTYPGAVVASLSTPWGFSGDNHGGYHLVWPRDAVEAGFAFLACGQTHDARAMLAYLISTQQADGHWLQNNFADGRPFWTGIQLDEAALPVLLAAKLDELGELGEMRPQALRMAHRALVFVARTGPFSPQDRWEENAGANPFTLATAVAALVAGVAHVFLDGADAGYALSLADDWNARIEEWVYATGTDLDREHGTAGHYVRITPPCTTAERGRVMLKNRGGETLPTRDLLGMEFLYLVRLGLRAANNPRVRDTVKLVDKLLRVDLPTGCFYRRYNEDGYGEHADGRPFDGTGIGRAWPLLAGERGHFAIDAGEDPLPYLQSMLASASAGGMIPEQVWDTAPIPERHLTPGRPSGSSMPLVWAHGEFLKLTIAAKRGAPIERLAAVAQRYAKTPKVTCRHWRDSSPCTELPCGLNLSIEADAPFTLHYGHDGWQDVAERDSVPVGLGLHGVKIDFARAGVQQSLDFTRRFAGDRGWERHNWTVRAAPTHAASP